MKVVYDIDAPEEDNTYLRSMEEALAAASTVFVPGRFAVEFLPFLKHAPAWFPGSGKQRVFRECKRQHVEIKNSTYAHVKGVVVSVRRSAENRNPIHLTLR